MNEPTGATRVESFSIGGACIGFSLTRSFVTDNLLLYVAPDNSYCRACFLRRYLSQMMQTVQTPSLAPAAVKLARTLDNDPANDGLWHVYAVREKTRVIAFELVPYQDCPVCSRPVQMTDEQAALEYETRLDANAAADYDGLRGRIFSFGFARRLTVDRVAGLPDPRYDKLLGDNYAARIYCRLIESAGNHMDMSTLGVSTDKDLAEKKAIMEYLERYAYLLNVCRYPTAEYDDRLIDDFMALYREPLTDTERTITRSKATWAFELTTRKLKPIPMAFIYCTPGIRFVRPTSSGFAAHNDFRLSLCKSVLELVERDAFVRFWHNPERALTFAPDQRTQADLDGISCLLACAVSNQALACRMFLLRSPTMLPVVLATISSSDFSKPPSLCFGCGAGFDLAGSIEDAVRELRFNVLNLIKGTLLQDGFLTKTFAEKIEGLQDRLNFYATASPRAQLRFLDRDNPLADTDYEDAETQSLDALIDRFRRVGIDLFAIDCTPTCFNAFNVCVTRALSPGLFPLQFQQEDSFGLARSELSMQSVLPHFFL